MNDGDIEDCDIYKNGHSKDTHNDTDVTIKDEHFGLDDIELAENGYYHKEMDAGEETLYENHIIKDELVIGPVVIQKPYINTSAYESIPVTESNENVLVKEQRTRKKIQTEIDKENLYENHIIKEELVIGEEIIQKRDAIIAYESYTMQPEATQHPHAYTSTYESIPLTEFNENIVLEKKQGRGKKIQIVIDKENVYDKDHIIEEELVIREVTIQKSKAITATESFTQPDNEDYEPKKSLIITKRNLRGNFIKDNSAKGAKKTKKNNATNTKTCESTNKTNLETNKSKIEPKHKQDQSKPNTNTCHICDKTFTLAANLARHIKIIHVGFKRYTCSKCGESFKYTERYKNHLLLKHAADNVREAVCKYCQSKLADRRTCDRHERFYCKRNKDKQVRPTTLLNFTCDVCQKSYKRKNSLEEHMAQHFGSIKIKKGKKLRNAFQFQCDYCGKVYVRKLSLKLHVQSKHMGRKSYSCLKCGKSFAWRWSLQLHERARCSKIKHKN